MKLKPLTFVFLAAILFVAPMLSIIQVAHAEYDVWNCVCDHYDNEAYLGTIYDMWTGSAIVGYYSGQGAYFDYVDQHWNSGYGSDANQDYVYPAIPPLNYIYYFGGVGQLGNLNYGSYTYSNDTYYLGNIMYGFYLYQDWYNQWAYDTEFAWVAANQVFSMPTYPDGSTNYNGCYADYGTQCAVEAPNPYQQQQNSIILQSSPSSSIQTTQSPPMFNVQISYAYVGQRTQCLSTPNPFQNQSSITTLKAASLYPSLICLNATKVSNIPIAPCDAQIEVYQIQVTTDTGIVENYMYTVGTNVNPSFSNAGKLSTLSSCIDSFPNAQNANRVEGYFNFNTTVGQSISGTRIGSLGEYQSKPSSMGFWSAGQPNAITISIHRLGYILLNGSSTSIVFSNVQTSATTQTQLAKFSNGFLCNSVVPQSELEQTDPFNPPV